MKDHKETFLKRKDHKETFMKGRIIRKPCQASLTPYLLSDFHRKPCLVTTTGSQHILHIVVQTEPPH